MTTITRPKHHDDLIAHLRESATLGSVCGLLGWDQETYMPDGGADARAEQSSLLAGIAHERATSERLGALIAACEGDAELTGDPETAAELREVRRSYDLATKLPGDLVREMAESGSKAQQAWKKARENDDFKAFEPWLAKMIDLARRKAACYGTPEGGEAYDALLDEYEPGAKAAEIEAVFTPLGARLSAFIKDLADHGTPPSDAPLNVKVPEAAQHAFGLEVLGAMGFDLDAGRLDTTAHPFCSGFAPGDTRLTTRYRDERFTDALYGTMHEGGHGLYEQGLPKDTKFGSPLASSISLGIHESQSRMWENFVGRSRQFWVWAKPIADRHFEGALDAWSVDDMTKAVNTAKPSFIRVEADEATYNLHVMLRFGIERALLRGDLEASDVPNAWNGRFEELFGTTPPDNRRGCLQDVHWSFGLIGYFPTYTLGNLYAAQLWETILDEVPDLESKMERGEFADLLAWLRDKIHTHGMRYRAGELCEMITGKPLGPDPLLRHLERRIRPAYGL
ncbi:MAG: carboxypeptidase M32 [Phycisphaeraceae bacterium]|nr:MAG: carboxypeptidase M32 [Phycisphaeraceae bacterium]